MRVESAVTSITWIPSEAISGMPKMPFEMGISHYDDPPPDRIDDLDALHENDLFREANELKAWIEVEDDKIVDHGYSGQGRIGVTRIKLGPRELAFAAVQYPLLQAEPEVGDGWVKFVQSAGGHMGLPAPRRVSGKPFFRVKSASAWTTLQLIVYADGSSKHSLLGASPFPRHWIYDKDGVLVEKSGTIDFAKWYRESHGAEHAVGRGGLADARDRGRVGARARPLRLDHARRARSARAAQARKRARCSASRAPTGTSSTCSWTASSRSRSTASPSPRSARARCSASAALLEGGKRTATLRAASPARVAVVPADAIDEAALPELAAAHKREQA